jgi:hypothetical protein
MKKMFLTKAKKQPFARRAVSAFLIFLFFVDLVFWWNNGLREAVVTKSFLFLST